MKKTDEQKKALKALNDLGESIINAVHSAPASDVLSILTGAFVSLTLELARHQGYDDSLEMKIDGGKSRDITIHAKKPD
jgi:hypothetical protein